MNWSDYDFLAVAFSGGKDSLACLLHLIEAGAPMEKVRLWHHCVDGQPGTDGLMDWPVTESYCRAIAKHFRVPLRLSWKLDGFEGEMHRENALTKPCQFEAESGAIITAGGKRGKLATRRRFPQVSADLSVRWCSAYLKIDVAKKILANDPAYTAARVLLITGERAAESPARARYAETERHPSSNSKRTVTQWRPVHKWTDKEVWQIIERHAIAPHPAYFAGFGRTSCLTCIFGGPDQWAWIKQHAPERFARIAAYEREFGATIRRGESVERAAARGKPYKGEGAAGLSREYSGPVHVPGAWRMPAGAFTRGEGPS